MSLEAIPEGPACDRCGARPAPNDARDLCLDCDPGTPLCDRCYVVHAHEVLDDARDDEPTTFYHSGPAREKLQLAADVVRLGRPPRTAGGTA
jgi:hypothetical protein